MDHEPEYRAARRPRHLGFADEDILAEVRHYRVEHLSGTITVKIVAGQATYLELSCREPAAALALPAQPLSEADICAALAAVRQREGGYGRVQLAIIHGAVAEIERTYQVQRHNRLRPGPRG